MSQFDPYVNFGRKYLQNNFEIGGPDAFWPHFYNFLNYYMLI